MSQNNEKDTDNKPVENPFVKGWNDFVSTMKNNYENFQASLEQQTKENIEKWNENKQKVDKFFQDVKEDWDSKLREWNDKFNKVQIESKEQWEAKKKKIENDFKEWQKKTEEDWENGVKTWNKFWIKSSWNFLLFMLPFLIILVVIAIVITVIFNAID